MKILVTGGFGNLGSWLTKRLLELGHNVVATSRRRQSVLTHKNLQIINLDIAQKEEVQSKLTGVFDVCIHLASYNEHFEKDYLQNSLKVNTLGTANLCERLIALGCKKVIYFSTFHVYGRTTSGQITENEVPCPANSYGLTHYFAEQYLELFSRTNNLNFISLRLTNSYGAPLSMETDKWYLIFNDFCKQAYNNNKIVLSSNGNLTRDFISMSAVCDVVIDLLDMPNFPNDVFNLSHGFNITLLHLAKIIKSCFENKYKADVSLEINELDHNEYSEFSVSNDKLRKLVSFKSSELFEYEALNVWKLLEENHCE